ncbi:MAG: hypothetical protein RI959_1386 [Pseudomonadota bacterium]
MYRSFDVAMRSPSGMQPIAPLHQAQAVAREYLPFTVRVVETDAALRKAVQIRHAAYARHIAPNLAVALQEPERLDKVPGAVVLLAESKVDGSPLGTMRIQTNKFGPLTLEQSVELPTWMKGLGLAEASRLGITQDKVGRMVKTVLFKAFYLYCLHNGIAHMVITARSPVDRMYDRLLFQDVYPGMGYVPLEHVFNLPHRILQLDVQRAQAMWQDADHPLLGFMCDTEHPDLMV